MSRVLCLGEMLIDFVPTENGLKLEDVPQFKKEAGGAPANVAACISNLGGEAKMISKVGADAFGTFLKKILEANQVGIEYVFQTTEAKTALAFVSLREDGERDFMFYREPSADMLLDVSDVQSISFEKGDIYHIGSISLIDEPVHTATVEGIKEAKANGGIVSFDPNIRLPLWPNEEHARLQINRYFPEAHIVKISEEELLFLTGIEDEKQAIDSLFQGDVQLILLTKGEKGCTYYTRKKSATVEGYSVVVQDTTGAGDAFYGAFLYKVSQAVEDESSLDRFIHDELNMKQVLMFANAAGALTTTKRGAISALPNQEVIKHLMGKSHV